MKFSVFILSTSINIMSHKITINGFIVSKILLDFTQFMVEFHTERPNGIFCCLSFKVNFATLVSCDC